MKIGILTHCIANNFGANLQALSTAMYLKNRGYTPFFFYWDAYLKKRSVKMDARQLEVHRSFLIRHGFEISRPCSTPDDFKKAIVDNDIKDVLVGSDAVLTVGSWIDRIEVGKKGVSFKEIAEDKMFPNPFWIPFAGLVPQCHFYYLSPSCQSTSYRFLPKGMLAKMRSQMSLFEYFSARDTCTKKMMEYILGNNATVSITPDPVWGFNHNVADIPDKEYVISKYNLNTNYYVASFYEGYEVSSSWLDSIRTLAIKDGCELYALPMPQGHFLSNLPKIELPIDPIDWFAIIKYSKGYIGNNMHPIIVSIHNGVPFFSIDQHGKHIWKFHFEKSSKVYDLLSRFNLMDYRIRQNSWKNVPPTEVYNKLNNFSVKSAKRIAQSMEHDYLIMMESICKKF